jgi:hypothetical protein
MRKIPFIFFYNPKFFFLNALLAGGWGEQIKPLESANVIAKPYKKKAFKICYCW